MRKFTDEELKLAPAVAEVMGWDSKEGDYYRSLDRLHRPIGDVKITDGTGWPLLPRDANFHWLPLEHDCLEWLSDNAWFVHGIQQRDHDTDGGWEVFVTEALENGLYVWDSDVTDHCKLGMGDTLLEALYRVIIECGQKGVNGE